MSALEIPFVNNLFQFQKSKNSYKAANLLILKAWKAYYFECF